MEITLSVNKEEVLKEVAVTTAYTGSKMDDDENALQRISTVDEDELHLERFWEECRADICQELIGLVIFEGMISSLVKPTNENAAAMSQEIAAKPTYELRLDVSKSFDEALLPSMKLSLFNYFVQGIVAKWYVYTNKKEAGDYAVRASALLDDVHRKAVYKRKPTRPTYDD